MAEAEQTKSTDAAPTVSRDPLYFMTVPIHNPCFRVALMYGIASGFGFMMHNQYKYRDWARSRGAFYKSFPVVSLLSWQYCRWSDSRSRAAAKRIIESSKDPAIAARAMQAAEERERAAAAAAAFTTNPNTAAAVLSPTANSVASTAAVGIRTPASSPAAHDRAS